MKRIWTILKNWKTARVGLIVSKDKARGLNEGSLVIVYYKDGTMGVWEWSRYSESLIEDSDITNIMILDGLQK